MLGQFKPVSGMVNSSFMLEGLEKKYIKQAREMMAKQMPEQEIRSLLEKEIYAKVGQEDGAAVVGRVMSRMHEKNPNKGNRNFVAHDPEQRLEATEKRLFS